MPLLWDVWLSCVSGFLFSSFRPILKNKFKKKTNEKVIFFLGLLFNQLVNVAVSVWAWEELDPNWILLYWMDPGVVGTQVHFIYACFPLFYVISYHVNLLLQKKHRARYSLLVVTTSWLIFTAIVFPDFVTLFKASDVATHGVDYPPQFLWEISSFPDKNALWFFPVNIGVFCLMFFGIVMFFLVGFELVGIVVAWKDFFKEKK